MDEDPQQVARRAQTEALTEIFLGQQKFLIACAVLTGLTMQPLSILFFVALVVFVRNKIKNASQGDFHTEGMEGFDVPEHTHFAIDDDYCKDDMFTISFPSFNVIAHGSKFFAKLDETKKAILYHEFGHCNRWDMAFFVLAVLVSLFYLIQPLVYFVWREGYYEENSGLPQAMGVVFALVALSALVTVKHDREHTADFYAMKFVPDIYLAFLRERVLISNLEKSENRLAAFLTTLWHPTWEKRLEYQSGSGAYSSATIFFRCFLFGSFVAAFMIYALLERGIGTVLYPLALCLYVISVACLIRWSLSVPDKLQFWQRLSLSGGHLFGVAAGLFAFFLLEVVVLDGQNSPWQLLSYVIFANFLTLLGVVFMLPLFIRNGAHFLASVFYASAVVIPAWVAAYTVFFIPDEFLPAYRGSDEALLALGAAAGFLYVLLFAVGAFALCCSVWLCQWGADYISKRVVG